MLQILQCIFWAVLRSSILTAMAFDYYIGICKPSTIRIIMNRTKCNSVLATWAQGLSILSSIIYDNPVVFCGSNEIDHYFCDIFPMLKIACDDTYITGVLLLPIKEWLLSDFCCLVSYVIILFTKKSLSWRKMQSLLPVGLISQKSSYLLTFNLWGYLRP